MEKEMKRRRRAGGPNMGAFPDVDKRILDLRKHQVTNNKRYAVAVGRKDFTFFKNLTAARVKVVTKGIGRNMRPVDEKRALEVAKPSIQAKQTAALKAAAKAAGFKLVKK